MKKTSDAMMIADAVKGHWTARMLPAPLLPYAQLMRLERPIGWWLLLLPCWWGLLLAHIAGGRDVPTLWPHIWYGFLFFAGAIVMRGAGCVVNDIVDRDIDAKVERTRGRPIPSGRISVTQALLFLFGLLALGLLVVMQFNRFTLLLSFASLAIVAVYPFMKRITYWPQLVLGFAFNWGALLGWASLVGALSAAPMLLYGGGIMWTLAYDTIYAHQDKDDDVLIGVKSTALRLGANTRYWLGIFFAFAVIFIAAAMTAAGCGILSYLGLALASLHGGQQVLSFDDTDPQKCLEQFRANRNFGLLILAGLLADTLVS
jgi:4-hydroxybenzoate polyprenyltransferase